ncbi:MAG: thiamine phosphate synthase [Pyrinomonadaceae bacterium]
MNLKLPRIYPITDARLSGLSHAEQVEKLIAGGAKIIQLREKHASPRDFYASAAKAVLIAKENGVKIIINDRVDIALALKADGVHLGQDDMPPEEARLILGERAIMGLSTHTVEQVRTASVLPLDYIAIGPIFPTRTKENPDAVVGLAGLVKIREIIPGMPIAAIGGINEENLLFVLDAGADAVAVIGAIVSDGAKIEETMRKFINLSANKY